MRWAVCDCHYPMHPIFEDPKNLSRNQDLKSEGGAEMEMSIRLLKFQVLTTWELGPFTWSWFKHLPRWLFFFSNLINMLASK